MRALISNTDVRELDHSDLLERLNELLADYDPPTGQEMQKAKVDRLSRTIDEMPEIYRWLVSLHSWLDHWSDSHKDMFGQNDNRYKRERQRRDLLEKMASSAKLRYDAASRTITLIKDFDTEGMPRSRA